MLFACSKQYDAQHERKGKLSWLVGMRAIRIDQYTVIERSNTTFLSSQNVKVYAVV